MAIMFLLDYQQELLLAECRFHMECADVMGRAEWRRMDFGSVRHDISSATGSLGDYFQLPLLHPTNKNILLTHGEVDIVKNLQTLGRTAIRILDTLAQGRNRAAKNSGTKNKLDQRQ